MFYGTFTDARIIANPKFKIVGKNITLESKLMDSGTRGTLYATHPSYDYILHSFLRVKLKTCVKR